LNAQDAGDIRQTKIHTAEPFMPEPDAAGVDIAIKKLKRYKVPDSDQIPAELIQAFTKRVIRLTAVVIEAYHCCQLHTKYYLTFFSLC
jgi:hypothetical protein